MVFGMSVLRSTLSPREQRILTLDQPMGEALEKAMAFGLGAGLARYA